MVDNKYKFSLFGLLFLLFVLFPNCFAQAQKTLSLEDAISISLEKSYYMKSLILSLTAARESNLAIRYGYRTQSNLSLYAPSWEEQITSVEVANALPVYNNLGQMRIQGELDIDQPLPTDGTLSLKSKLYRSRQTNDLASSDETLKRTDFLTSLSLELTQPLFTYNRLKTNLKSAELSYENTRLASDRSKMDIIYNVTDSFFSLFQGKKSYEISTETFEQKKKAYELAKLKYESGLIPEVDALQPEVDMESARASMMKAKSSYESLRDQFKMDLGLDLDEDVDVETAIKYTHFDIDTEKAIDCGLKYRTEMREKDISIELKKIDVIKADAKSEIHADLSMFYDLTGVSDSSLPYDTGTNDLFHSSWVDLKRRPPNRGVTLTFSIPVWDWGVNKAEVASAKANLRQSELDKEQERKEVVLSVRNAVRNVQTAEENLLVLEKSQNVAQRSYEISLARFDNGEITSQELALDNNRLSSAKMAYLNAYTNYKLAVADLKRKTLWDFENDKPVR